MRKFQCGARSKRSHDSLTGREEKANAGYPVGTARTYVGREGLQLSKSIFPLHSLWWYLTHTAILKEQRHLFFS